MGMGTWVLIMVIVGPSAGSVITTSVGFYTQVNCQEARATLLANLEAGDRLHMKEYSFSFCTRRK